MGGENDCDGSLGIYFVYRTQMTQNKGTKTMKQYQADFPRTEINKENLNLFLSFYVLCVQYTKFWLEFGIHFDI